jgi:hypothetical protein
LIIGVYDNNFLHKDFTYDYIVDIEKSFFKPFSIFDFIRKNDNFEKLYNVSSKKPHIPGEINLKSK